MRVKCQFWTVRNTKTEEERNYRHFIEKAKDKGKGNLTLPPTKLKIYYYFRDYYF